MFDFMVGKKDTGSYWPVFEHYTKFFASKDPLEMAANSGADFNREKSVIRLSSLGQLIDIAYPSGEVYFGGSNLIPIWNWRLVIINYLWRSNNAPLAGMLISYRELEGGQVFYPAFLRESIRPLASALLHVTLGGIIDSCVKLGARFEEGADICAVFDFLPRFPITVKMWLGDEEMESSANILFDVGANHYLHTEDIAVAGNLISIFLTNLLKTVNG